MSKMNLNELRIPVEHWPFERQRPLDDYSCSHGDVAVYFRNLKERLIEFISSSSHVLGCVAWLTDPDILDALSEVSCSIVVQKEDFLRPDVGAESGFRNGLREKYERLTNRLWRHDAFGTISEMSTGGDPAFAAVRCVGNFNRSRSPAFPRMHNKFLVSCQKHEPTDSQGPVKVWTGSFNFTKNAGMSFENAVVIDVQKIAWKYTCEWSQIMALSEPLDWESDWCAPEWRIGT